MITNSKTRLSATQRYYELLYVLVERNLKGRYRGSFLGVYWSLLYPLTMTIIYTAIFGTVFKEYYDNSIINYILAAFTGLVVTNFFNAATMQALVSVVNNGAMLNKVKLPMSIFPVSAIMANIFQLVVGVFPMLLGLALVIQHPILNGLLLFIPLIAMILVCTGVGLMISALYVYFRDLPYFYEIFCFIVWITTPVFYPSDIVPTNIRPFLQLNPLAGIVEMLREVTLFGDIPSIWLIVQTLISGIIILGLGWSIFQSWQKDFMDLL